MNHLSFQGLSRRHFVGGLAATGLPACLAGHTRPGAAQAVPITPMWGGQRLILFTLYGGNDGLNTVVPYRDPLYRRLRPTVGLPADAVLPLNDDIALHPALRGLMTMFQAGEVAVLQEVGYPEPNLSHFESAAIWDSAQPRRDTRVNGWFGDAVMRNRAAFDAARFDAAAVSFDSSTGFAAGTGVPVLVVGQNLFGSEPGSLAPPDRALQRQSREHGTAARLAQIVEEGRQVRQRFATRLAGVAAPLWKPYEEPLAIQTRLTEWLLTHGATAPVIRLSQDGYDTHAGLLVRQADLLASLDAALLRLKQGLLASGEWQRSVVMVHSEFGRRAAENAHGGTDHGSAGPVLLIGGKVRGGIYGRRAQLDDLDADGNLHHGIDFRSVYATVIERLWQLPGNPPAAAGFAPLDIALA